MKRLWRNFFLLNFGTQEEKVKNNWNFGLWGKKEKINEKKRKEKKVDKSLDNTDIPCNMKYFEKRNWESKVMRSMGLKEASAYERYNQI